VNRKGLNTLKSFLQLDLLPIADLFK